MEDGVCASGSGGVAQKGARREAGAATGIDREPRRGHASRRPQGTVKDAPVERRTGGRIAGGHQGGVKRMNESHSCAFAPEV